MFNNNVIKKLLVFFLVFFTLLINSAYLFLSTSYENGNYSEYNTNIRTEFYKNTPWEKIDFGNLCSSLKPDLFLQNYNKIVFLSLLMIAVSILAIYSSYKKKILSKNEMFVVAIVIILSILVFLKAWLIEADYDFIGCYKFWLNGKFEMPKTSIYGIL